MPELTTKDALLERMVAATSTLKGNIQNMAPVGCVQAFAGSTTPDGWLLCDGSAVSRTTYAALFAVIGTTYGAGDGSTTFNLPNLVNKFVEGSATSGTVKTAGLPNITGSAIPYVSQSGGAKVSDFSGAFKRVFNASVSYGSVSAVGSNVDGGISLDASKSSAIYGNSDTVQPPALTMRYIIKY